MEESFKDNHGARLKPEADSPLKDKIRPLIQEKIRMPHALPYYKEPFFARYAKARDEMYCGCFRYKHCSISNVFTDNTCLQGVEYQMRA